MYNLGFLYEFSSKNLDIEKEKGLIFNIALWGTIEAKSLLLYKINREVVFHNYELTIDILNTIIDSTEYNLKSENIYKYIIAILNKIVDEFFEKIKIGSIVYYKIIVLSIKVVKVLGGKSVTRNLVRKIAEKMETVDRETFLRLVFKQIRNQINFHLSPQTINLLLDNLLNEPEKDILNYLVFLNNLKYPPYLTQISFENIIKIAKKLNNFRNKIKSTKLRGIFIEILENYFANCEIHLIIENFEKLKNDFYLKNLFIKTLNHKINSNPSLIEEKNIEQILRKLSMDKSSLIKVKIFSNENFPLHIRLNAFNTRKYSIQRIVNYLNK
ncbi:MAG: hypothetical protein ACK4GJ_01135 [bacterium]